MLFEAGKELKVGQSLAAGKIKILVEKTFFENSDVLLLLLTFAWFPFKFYDKNVEFFVGFCPIFDSQPSSNQTGLETFLDASNPQKFISAFHTSKLSWDFSLISPSSVSCFSLSLVRNEEPGGTKAIKLLKFVYDMRTRSFIPSAAVTIAEMTATTSGLGNVSLKNYQSFISSISCPKYDINASLSFVFSRLLFIHICPATTWISSVSVRSDLVYLSICPIMTYATSFFVWLVYLSLFVFLFRSFVFLSLSLSLSSSHRVCSPMFQHFARNKIDLFPFENSSLSSPMLSVAAENTSNIPEVQCWARGGVSGQGLET